jgi:hypothetical protein
VLSEDMHIYALKHVPLSGADKQCFINEINLLKKLKNRKEIIQYHDSEIKETTQELFLVNIYLF